MWLKTITREIFSQMNEDVLYKDVHWSYQYLEDKMKRILKSTQSNKSTDNPFNWVQSSVDQKYHLMT